MPLPSFSWPSPSRDPSMWRFRDRFSVDASIEPVSLGEGGTALSTSALSPGVRLHWKQEFRNPTGSHKDRALSLAVTHAKQIDAKLIAVVSAGSTGLSGAAYAARAGLPSVTLMSRGVPGARIQPVFSLGSRLIAFETGIDPIIDALRKLSGKNGLYVASTTLASNAIQAEACRTIAYEIVESLGAAPNWLIVPVGGGGTIASIWKGFNELVDAGLIGRAPRLVAAVPESYDALARAMREDIHTWDAFAAMPYSDDVETILTKLSHAHPPDGLLALQALRETAGMVVTATDDECLDAVGEIGRTDGIFLEPSSAIVLPVLRKLTQGKQILDGDIVVALACGSGFRETFAMQQHRPLVCETASLRDLDRLME